MEIKESIMNFEKGVKGRMVYVGEVVRVEVIRVVGISVRCWLVDKGIFKTVRYSEVTLDRLVIEDKPVMMYKKWSVDDKERFRGNLGKSNKELAIMFDRSERSIEDKRYRELRRMAGSGK